MAIVTNCYRINFEAAFSMSTAPGQVPENTRSCISFGIAMIFYAIGCCRCYLSPLRCPAISSGFASLGDHN